jgi:hypothetical protein
MMINQTPSPASLNLADAMYALNRALTELSPAEREALDRFQYENITIARDLIWGVRRTLDPTLKD